MELLPTVAAPGVGERADAAAEAACHLHDAVTAGGWSRTAAEDAAEAIETTAHALGGVHPRAELILAPVHMALAELRRHLELPPADPVIAAGVPQTPRTVGNPRRTRRQRPPVPATVPVPAAAPAPAGPPPSVSAPRTPPVRTTS
ncbi:hypothetical protein [Streptomyces sp. NPDC090022]|uniref:hypothetical protein n=1 Tax=Streptomyces sp. NPDC090022 TaxID=3365920 RepID=UPI00380E56D4